MELGELQSRFQRSLLANDDGAADLIVGDGRLSSPERLKIYREAYRLRLLEALGENFIGLRYLLGDDGFNTLGRAYIDATPSHFTSVRWYGETLPGYLANTAPYHGKPLLAEMAEYEWKLLLAFDADEAEPVTPEVMGSFPPDQWPHLAFRFHPGVQRAEFKWSVVRFHQQAALHAENEELDIDPPEQTGHPVSWVIWRDGISQKYRSMEVDEAWAMDHARAGGDFAGLCAGLCEWTDTQHAPGRAAGFLKGWLNDGLIIEVISGM